MILGIGSDIVEISAAKALYNNQRFIKKAFTPAEAAYCEKQEFKHQHYAARFAAKEATMKALGCGWNYGIQWNQIEIIRENAQPPSIRLYGTAEKWATDRKVRRIHLTLSHTENYALAFVLIEI